MNTISFLSTPLLWGLALAAIPLLIHLLYRRQYRRVEWAPMRYLKLSIQRNRRRVRIEQLLLLLARTCIVLLLFLAVARPMMHAAGLSALWGASSRTSRIVVLDDSLSMGYAEAGKSAVARAQEIFAELLSTFGDKDRLTLVLASRPSQPLLRKVELRDTDEILQVVRGVQPGEVFVGWEPVLQAVDQLIVGGSYPLHEVTLLTDLRKAGWDTPLAELGDRWTGRHARLQVFDVGVLQTTNVALLGLRQVDRLALSGVPTRFEATVRNDSPAERAAIEAHFIVDGRPTLVRIPSIAPGEVARVPLVATLNEPGPHDLSFELPNDDLAGDNQRWIVAHVQQSIDMLLVDGEPSNEPLGGETDFLALALSLSADAAEPFRVEIIGDAQWASSPAARPDLLVLANVPRLSAEQAEQIEQLVADGAGLMIFLGEQIDPDNYNQLLYRDGAGILGAALETVSDTELTGLLVEQPEGSPLEAVGQLSPAALARVKIRKWYEVRMPPTLPEGVRVLARWNNAQAAPAVIQRRFGRGQVLLWTTGADRGWSDWPTESSYVLAVREAARAIARSTASLRDFTAGQALRVGLPDTHDISLPSVEVPHAKEPKPLTITTSDGPAKKDANSARSLVYNDTRRAGLYKFAWRDSASGAMSEQFAVSPDPRESDLARVDRQEFVSMWGSLEPDIVAAGTSDESGATVRGKEIWRMLATGLLGLLVFEACFARWCGRQR